MHPSSTAVLGHLLATTLLHQLMWLLAVAIAVALVVAGLTLRGAPLERLGLALLGRGRSTVEPGARRFLRVGFGLLWLICGALQAQSGMPSGFVSHVIDGDQAGQPGWIGDLAAPFNVGRPRFEADDMVLPELKLGCVFDRDDALILGNKGREHVEHRRLAGTGAAGDHDVEPRLDARL